MKKKPVAIVMGSDSDLPIMQEATKMSESEIKTGDHASAHRSPDLTAAFAKNAAQKGHEVIIAGAGAAAHLAGVIASKTTLPVIGVPIDSSSLKGLDSLLSTVQMPGGVPVASMAIGKAGAKNAALYAVQILALKYPELKKKLTQYKKRLASGISQKARRLAQTLNR